MKELYNRLYFSEKEFQAYSLNHLIMTVLVILIVAAFIYLMKTESERHYGRVRVTLLILLFLQQIGLYTWYLAHGAFDPIDALPLYPCRLWQISAILYLITERREFFAINFLMGIPSAVLAFVMPDTSGFGFPNLMFIQFYVGHLMLLLVPIYGFFKEEQQIDRSMLKFCMIIYVVYMVSVSFINKQLGSNYGYVSAPPYDNSFFQIIDPIYPILYMGFAFLVLKAWYRISERISEKFLMEQEV